MKKLLAYLLIFVMALTAVTAGLAETAEEPAAEEASQITYDYEELTVAVTTPLTGNFILKVKVTVSPGATSWGIKIRLSSV